jgi:hypothetical protein
MKGCARGLKCDYFVSLSSITSMKLNLLEQKRPSIKSIMIIYHAFYGTGKGFRSPMYFALSVLAY